MFLLLSICFDYISDCKMDLNKLENLPRDVLFYFAIEFDLPTVYNLCRTSSKLNQKLCQSDEFWSQRLFHDYQIRYQDIGGKSNSKNILRLLNQYKTRRLISFITGKKLEQKDIDEMLRDTAEKGYLDVVKFLLEKGADINANKNAAVRYASYFGRLETVRYLVEQGANIHTNDDEALIWASTNKHIEIIKYLLDQGADINVAMKSAIDKIRIGYTDQNQVLQYLIEYQKSHNK